MRTGRVVFHGSRRRKRIWYQNYGGHLDNVVHTWKGYLSSAVLLYDAEYISIRNLEITNNPCVKNERLNQADRMEPHRCIRDCEESRTLHEIELDHLYIHDVEEISTTNI